MIRSEEHETAPKIMTVPQTPERAAATRQAVGEVLTSASVRAYDPNDPKEKAAYIGLVVAREQRMSDLYLEENGVRVPIKPRTAEEIDREIIDYAINNGLELVAIEHQEPDKLGVLWTRVDQIMANA